MNDCLPPSLRPGYRTRVTAILPCYNHARFLPERIGSILEQYCPPDEIIFLDDCSTDDSVAVAESLLSKGHIPYRVVVNETNSGSVFRQWLKGMEMARHDLIWVAETDDSADTRFLANLLPAFQREDVLIAYGRIRCIDPDGNLRQDLDNYYDGLHNLSWTYSQVLPAYKAFGFDFAVRNVIPNASGVVFRKPLLTPAQIERLCQYRFAGDWYFYAMVLRGGAMAYRKNAKSWFRVNAESTSRSSFFTERHLREHRMVIEDLRAEYGIDDAAVEEHARKLAAYFPKRRWSEIRDDLHSTAAKVERARPLRVCVGAHSFAVGGGEVLPLELANKLKQRGHHVTYLVLERQGEDLKPSVRGRLRPDIPVVHWADVKDNFAQFIRDYGIDVFNSHNVGIEYHLSRVAAEIPAGYVVSLHGGYETVAELITPAFVSYVEKRVDTWLFLSEKNKRPLLDSGLADAGFVQSFNAVPDTTVAWEDRAAFRAEHDISDDAFCMVICSRAIEEKGWQTAVDVCQQLNERERRPVHVVLIGSGPVADSIRSDQAGNPHVHVLGYVENPMRYFRCFDLGIFPSVYVGETFPLFLIECLEAGLPVVSSDIGEIPQIMGDREVRPGALVSCKAGRKEMTRAMTAAIETYMTDHALYARLVESAVATSRRFSMDKLADFYLGVLTDAANNNVR